jgi:hypothetical protein
LDRQPCRQLLQQLQLQEQPGTFDVRCGLTDHKHHTCVAWQQVYQLQLRARNEFCCSFDNVTNEQSSIRRNSSLAYYRGPLYIFYWTFFNQILPTSNLVLILQHIKKGVPETTYRLTYSRLSLLKKHLMSQMGYYDMISAKDKIKGKSRTKINFI